MDIDTSRKLLGVGFLLSFLTLGFVYTVILIFFALFTYFISIILRSIGWYGFGQRISGFFKATGLSIIIFGTLFFLTLLTDLTKFLGVSPETRLFLAFVFWAIYSLMELISYFRMASIGSRIFYIAMISIVGIILVLLFAYNLAFTEGFALNIIVATMFRLAIIPLMLSSLAAAVASFKSQLIEVE